MASFAKNCRSFKRHHSLEINRAISFILFATCVICIALLVLLFLIPEALQLRSLQYVTDGIVSPSVAIGLLTTLLGGAISPLLTTAVEHSFWLKLSARDVQNRLTVAECNRLAQWSVSSLHRLTYILEGQSFLLRLGGPLLFATAVLGPVLQAVDQFAGFLDRSNSAYNGGNFQDNLMTAAALAQMGGLKAPASPLCSSAGCRAEALAGALQAECQGREIANPRGLGLQSYLTTASGEFCSEANPNLCVQLQRNDPAVFVDFVTTYPTGCETEMGPACAGEWATIFGAWVNAIDAPFNSTPSIHTVDCAVRFGNISITQEGRASPDIDRASFDKSVQTEIELGAAVNAWRRIYTSEATQSPYTFVAGQGGASGANTLYENNSLALLLLNYADSTGADATTVAGTIEANFDMGTLFAFARAPEAASINMTTQTSVNVWRYDARFLAVFAIPVLAMVVALWGRWRIGDDEDVVTYLPIEIARRGPVGHFVEGESGESGEALMVSEERLSDEKTLVWGVKEPSDSGLKRGPSVKIVTAGTF